MTDTALDLQDSSFVVQLVYPALIALGLDIDQIAERCNITPDLLQTSQARYPHAAQQRFWQVVEEISGDPLIGLHLAEVMSLHKGQVWEYLFLSSPTFGDGLQRALNYQRLVSDASRWELRLEGDTACLDFTFNHEPTPEQRHFVEASALYLIRYFRALTHDSFAPRHLAFSHEAAASIDDYRAVMGCDVAFAQPSTTLTFDAKVMELPSSRAEPELLKLHEQLANERLARLQKQDIVVAVRTAIAETLEQGQPELNEVAQRLGLSVRVLRARLTEAETSFNQVLADYRCYLAKRLLSRTEEPIADIVYLTGFSEPSTFYRAFKRWTGMTPVEYRDYKRTQLKAAP
ncbi:AraC-like DNA-binding protein [Litorivivens lipolytica]|uniref:AraC-like DNA-binding protein n=1 Tax=Litorivivens lipolytica TaxID=1524264 RepID=A0A7W4Z4T1_9GAMM|nr:AraC family transcriptional regulator [Litorivivens lipolytica]MBB3046804.1 AraC-like DNA-binding protein [Litorivivens lipolytica]